jgi:hypothetical protein
VLFQPRIDPLGFQTDGSSPTNARVTQLATFANLPARFHIPVGDDLLWGFARSSAPADVADALVSMARMWA